MCRQHRAERGGSRGLLRRWVVAIPGMSGNKQLRRTMEATGRKIRNSRWIRGGMPGQDSLQSPRRIPNLLWIPNPRAVFPLSRSPWERSGCWGRLYPAHSREGGVGSLLLNCSAFWGVLLHAGSAGSFLRVVERIPRDPAPGRAGTIPKSPNPAVCAIQLLLPELRCRERFPGNPAPELPFPSNPAGGGGRGAIPVLEEHRDGVKCPWDFLGTDPRKRGKTGGKAWRPLPVESF